MSKRKPRLSKPPSAEELRTWTAAQQQAALANREAELIAEAAKLEKPPEGERWKARAIKHVHRAINPLTTRQGVLGDAADALAALAVALKKVEALP